MFISILAFLYVGAFGGSDDGLLPGVFSGYSNDYTAARQVIDEIHGKMMKVSWVMIGGLITIACLMYLTGAIASAKVNPQELVLKGILVVALLAGYNTIFGMIMGSGRMLSDQIANSAQMLEAAKEINEAKESVTNNQGDTATEPGVSMLKAMGTILFALDGTALLTAAIIGLCIILMFLGSLFVNAVWLIFVVALYIFGPISIAMCLLPGVGNKITSTWFGAIVQLSFWQVWMAICWRMIIIADLIHPLVSGQGSIGSTTSTVNSFEAAAFALVFALLFMATPFIVQGLIPLSSFSAMAGTMGLFLEAKALGAMSGSGGGSGSGSQSSSTASKPAPTTSGGGKGAQSGASAGAGGGGGGGAAAGSGASAGGGAAAAAGPAGVAVAAGAVAVEQGSKVANAVRDSASSTAQDSSNGGGR